VAAMKIGGCSCSTRVWRRARESLGVRGEGAAFSGGGARLLYGAEECQGGGGQAITVGVVAFKPLMSLQGVMRGLGGGGNHGGEVRMLTWHLYAKARQ
jgi:hypothetical protein